MTMPLLRMLAPLLLLGLMSGPAHAQKVYKWVDENGQVHYGDKIPPEYANRDREILNKQGMAIGREEGAETPEEARARQEQERLAREAQLRAQRDRMLLQTYQSVDDIELLRARRLDQLDAQLLIQEQSLASLRARHAEQIALASHYRPVNTDPRAMSMPEGMADDIARAESDIRVQEINLLKRRRERSAVNAQFDADIVRYKELREIK